MPQARTNRALLIWATCVILFVLSDGKVTSRSMHGTSPRDEHSRSEIVYPERVDHLRYARATGNQRSIEVYRMFAFGRNLSLVLHKNRLIIPEKFVLRTLNSNEEESINSHVRNCHYQGYVAGGVDSAVVLDTCDGLSGTIESGGQEYEIVPVKNKPKGAHKISQVPMAHQPARFNCGVKNETGSHHILPPAFFRDSKGSSPFSTRENRERVRRSAAIEHAYRSFIKTPRTRYMELMVIVDNDIYKKFGNNSSDVQRRVLNLINAIDKVYQKINIRIILSGLEIWNESNIVPPVNKAGEDLENFQKYREKHPLRYDKFDGVHLLRGKLWDDYGGMAYKTTVCTTKSTGVVYWNDWNLLGPWLGLSHEMGHTFGMDHDGKSCKCLTPRGCIMGPFKTRIPGFSDCNMRDLRNIDDKCLNNAPSEEIFNRCGNGIKESNEQCDCGTPEVCRMVDRCCNPHTCRLYAHAQCSDRRDKCCRNCSIAPSGMPCRAAADSCDVPEVCDGKSHKCPVDDLKIDGTACVHHPDYELVGNDKEGMRISSLAHHIRAQFIRINPQHWSKAICMRAEIYGCSLAESDQCDSSVDSALVFTEAQSCNGANFQFAMSASGVLRHTCSGNMVCPRSESGDDGVSVNKLVVNNRCTEDQAVFERVGKVLRHKATGMCVHPFNGYPINGIPVVLWSGCSDSERIRIDFVKQDCSDGLGVSNERRIRDYQITASSSRPNKPAQRVRLGDHLSSWCATIHDTRPFVQIDLGVIKRVSAIGTEGIYGEGHVTGYLLYHSEDGQRWNLFTGSDALANNSFCYRGKCASTHKSQCRDQIGPGSWAASTVQDQTCGKLQCAKPANARIITNATVNQGTKCGEAMICTGNTCQPIARKSPCVAPNGQLCKGVCTTRGKCHCTNGKDPKTNCRTALVSRDGGWGPWSAWTNCTRACDKGERQRHRHCDNPAPSYGGHSCRGEKQQRSACNTQPCPVAHSCRHLQKIGREKGITYPSGIYTINPGRRGNVKTYCDMSRDGGGWTLLVTSHTNTWTPSVVRKRNENKPSLDDDFSILSEADSIKDEMYVKGATFEYRIEAQQFGRWGGIWTAPRHYTFLSTNNSQQGVELVRRFDEWVYHDYGIEKTMPWIHGATLTTSRNATHVAYGTITGNDPKSYPAAWINEKEHERHPINIWYWMREGEYTVPSSCLKLQQQMLLSGGALKDGIFRIQPARKEVITYCDFSSHGGGWTLLLTSTSYRSGSWQRGNSFLFKDSKTPFNTDFSILGESEDITQSRHFQYRIEADGTNTQGGVFAADAGTSFTRHYGEKPYQVRLLKQFGQWDTSTESITNTLPHIRGPRLTTASRDDEMSGTLASLAASSPEFTYMKKGNKKPMVIRLWIREGTWRSCNEILLKRHPRLRPQSSVFMIRRNAYEYLPVYCNMTQSQGGWTLLVTSTKNNWKANQVESRNIHRPSLSRDYSILGLGDQLKALSGATSFKYKLEANDRGRWGGVWLAPMEYTFTSTTNIQTNVSLVRKYNSWEYNWRNSLEKRMPWLGKTSGLLTTSTDSDYSEWGTVISSKAENNPAPWISPEMVNPGAIWYWMNEDDCDASRQPVHGGLSVWSTWSECGSVCEWGVKTRTRSCSGPKPRCGGKTCNATPRQTTECYHCPRSSIRNGRLCIKPVKSGSGCSVYDGTKLVYTDSQCDGRDAVFLYVGLTLKHECSGKYVCPEGRTGYDFLVLKTKCDADIEKFNRTEGRGLQHVATPGTCVHPNGGSPGAGVKLRLWPGCQSPDNKLVLDMYFKGKSPPKPASSSTPTAPKTTTNPATPTAVRPRGSPIRARGGFCLRPESADCSPAEGAHLVYDSTGNPACAQTYMSFELLADGRLKHRCSKKYVCPEDSNASVYEGMYLTLKRSCAGQKAVFKRTSSKYLMYGERFCVQPESGIPITSGDHAVLYTMCNDPQYHLDFFKLPPVN
ncbi:uncharacterized protein LOC5517368 isoform X2 [Nematostella vectensis]|uniref:uncharacterized protein LOC5517368 isoform X2 n=1 Tax=Nematostella vectensis TaxID=45351 RepID=UPI00207772F6|nr:uncharacterized protein LOC5517368 isoform X2 [Nematostella vectensis]